jgi:hypothetical protein
LLAPSPRLAPRRQLEIYRDSIRANHIGALAAVYPVCRRLVGSAFFSASAGRFVRETPSVSADLNEYGAGFAGFLERFPPASSLPYLPDVARLEWAVHGALRSPEVAGLDPRVLERVPEAARHRLRFETAPGTSLLASRYPIDRIWAANQGDAEPPIVDLDGGGARLVVRRVEDDVRVEGVESAVFDLLVLLAAGEPLGSACVRLLRAHPDADLGAGLGRVLAAAWLVAFTIGGDSAAREPGGDGGEEP